MPTVTADASPSSLDKLEANLPTVPARVLRLQRTLAGAAYDRTAAVVDGVAESTKRSSTPPACRARPSPARPAPPAATSPTLPAPAPRPSPARPAPPATQVAAHRPRTGAKTGRRPDDGRRASKVAETRRVDAGDEGSSTRRSTPSRTQPGTGTPYEQWTKAELVERAKELDIAGRARMTRRELIAALRAA